MLGRTIISLLLVIPVLIILSCTKMPEWTVSGEGNLAVEKLPEIDSIPLEWGNLVTVNPNPDPSACQLWFQDENGNLRMIVYDMRANEFMPNARLIPRK